MRAAGGERARSPAADGVVRLPQVQGPGQQRVRRVRRHHGRAGRVHVLTSTPHRQDRRHRTGLHRRQLPTANPGRPPRDQQQTGAGHRVQGHGEGDPSMRTRHGQRQRPGREQLVPRRRRRQTGCPTGPGAGAAKLPRQTGVAARHHRAVRRRGGAVRVAPTRRAGRAPAGGLTGRFS